jgi:hypothetical protein
MFLLARQAELLRNEFIRSSAGLMAVDDVYEKYFLGTVFASQ